MFLRASGLAIGATASSMSMKIWSAGRPRALSSIFGLLPGTARLERRERIGRAAESVMRPTIVPGSGGRFRQGRRRRSGPAAGADHHRHPTSSSASAGSTATGGHCPSHSAAMTVAIGISKRIPIDVTVADVVRRVALMRL